MYADWLHQLQLVGGAPLMNDMFQGAEAYLEMWERAYGVPATSCLPSGDKLTRSGIGPLRLGETTIQALYRAGQPVSRPGTRTATACPAGLEPPCTWCSTAAGGSQRSSSAGVRRDRAGADRGAPRASCSPARGRHPRDQQCGSFFFFFFFLWCFATTAEVSAAVPCFTMLASRPWVKVSWVW